MLMDRIWWWKYESRRTEYFDITQIQCRSQWPRGLRRRSAASRLLRLWVRVPSGVAWMFVCCECCVLSGRGLCDELIARLEESYRVWCVVVCDLETSRMRRPWPVLDRSATGNKTDSVWIINNATGSVYLQRTFTEGKPANNLKLRLSFNIYDFIATI